MKLFKCKFNRKIDLSNLTYFFPRKYEEIYPPDVREFVYITDDTYTKKQVIRMEHLILKVLSFDLSVPTPLTFITAIAIAGRMPEKVIYLAMVSLFFTSCCHSKELIFLNQNIIG